MLQLIAEAFLLAARQNISRSPVPRERAVSRPDPGARR